MRIPELFLIIVAIYFRAVNRRTDSGRRYKGKVEGLVGGRALWTRQTMTLIKAVSGRRQLQSAWTYWQNPKLYVLGEAKDFKVSSLMSLKHVPVGDTHIDSPLWFSASNRKGKMYKYDFMVCRVWAPLNDFGNKTLEFSMVLHGLTLAS